MKTDYFLKINLIILSLITFFPNSFAQKSIQGKSAFSMQKNRIVQGNYFAEAVSASKLTSNYESPANLFQSADISFKFAINGRDNEMASGEDHHFTVEAKNGYAETPIIIFGKQIKHQSDKKKYLQANTKLKIRLDGRQILNQFASKGYYTCFNGTKIYKQDFKGIYIAGGTLPMIWDFDNLIHNEALLLKDDDGNGIYETELILNAKQDQKQIAAEWNLSKDISAFPQYHSNFQLSNALYNMSLEEMIKAVEPDSTFRTGKEWAGVWTRDVSYSIILSMAFLQPQVAKNSLLKKVNKKKRIIQDTGTGGAYPISTDRMIWSVAAWEVYTATGDKEWLQLAYEIVKNSIEDDQKTCYDPKTGMVKGESSFLDWREQTYPKWMQPADIFESECLGTNAVHYQANIVLSKMANTLGHKDVASKHEAISVNIKKGINQYLWMPEKGFYGQFLYGRNYKIVSPRSEALGEALCVLFGIADKKQAEQIISSVPLTEFGISCIYPQIPDIPPYHNNAVWPFVETYWALASAKSGNETAVIKCIQSIYRPAALFLTNKENFVADNGDYAGTQINSSNMLWSLSGNIGLIHKLIFGINFHSHSLVFNPFVPQFYEGEKTLTNFKYRNAVLDIHLDAIGNSIKTFLLDGIKQKKSSIPDNLIGHHRIQIVMDNEPIPAKQIQQTENYTTVATPIVQQSKNNINWKPVERAITYEVLRNGKIIAKTAATEYTIFGQEIFSEYQVIALDKNQVPSFASEPIQVYSNKKIIQVEAELNTEKSNLPYLGYSESGFVETSKTINPLLNYLIEVKEDGLYSIDFKYANGNGPTNTENKCAIRSLLVNNKLFGTIILPQRGTNEWSNWGYSNSVHLKLVKGKHSIQLSLEDYDDNMNIQINQAMIDFIRIIKLD